MTVGRWWLVVGGWWLVVGSGLMAESAIRALLAGRIDDAGLFPPPALSMADAVANYAAYRDSADAWPLSVLANDRARFARSFGPCLFREPIDDLSALPLQ